MPVAGGSAGSANAVRAGRAFVELSMQQTGIEAVFGNLQKRVQAFARTLAKAGGGLAAAGASVLGPFAKLASDAVEQGAEFQKLATVYGGTVEQMSALAYAADASGSSFEKVKSALENLPERIADAAKNGGSAAEAFREMGVNAAEILNKSPTDQLAAIADGMARVTTATGRAGNASKIFSDVGLEGMIPLLKDGSKGLKALTDEAARVGAVMTGDDARASVEVTRSVTAGYAALKSVLFQVGAAILPQADGIKSLAGSFIDGTAKVREFLKENRQTVFAVVSVAAAVAVAGTALVGLAGVLAAGSIALGAVGSVVSGLVAAFGLLLSPIGLAAAAVAGLGYLFVTQSEAGRKFGADTRAVFSGLKATAETAVGGVADAFAAGDLKLAAEVGLAGVSAAWASAMAGLTRLWNDFKSFFVDGWHDAVMLFKLAWNDAQGAVGGGMTSLLGSLAKDYQIFFTTLFSELAKLSRLFGQIPDELKPVAYLAGGPLAAALDGTADELDQFAELSKKGQLGGVFDAAGKALAKETEAQSSAIIKAAQAAQAARDKARQQDADDARRAADQAETDLQNLADAAALVAAARRKGPGGATAGGGVAQLQQAAAAVRGQFGGDLARQSVGGDATNIPAKQLTEAQRTNVILEKVADKVSGLSGAVFQ